MLLFNKSYQVWNKYMMRDLLFQLHKSNSYALPSFNTFQILLKDKNVNVQNILSLVSLNILLLDKYPFIIRVKNTIDKKKKKNLIGFKNKLTYGEFLFFFLCFK